MNKRGQTNALFWGVVAWAGILIIILLAVLVNVSNLGSFGGFVSDFPQGVQTAVDIITTIGTPIVDGIYALVAPAGQDENVQMIALAIFFLLLLIGTKTLEPFFKSHIWSFFISLIIGVIAARSLTATILEESALAASPLAAVSLLLGFLPVFVIARSVNKWDFAKQPFSKMVIFTVVGAVYLFFFAVVYEAITLGIVYGIGIVLLGVTEILGPWWAEKRRERTNINTGQTMGRIHRDIEDAQDLSLGYSDNLGK